MPQDHKTNSAIPLSTGNHNGKNHGEFSPGTPSRKQRDVHPASAKLPNAGMRSGNGVRDSPRGGGQEDMPASKVSESSYKSNTHREERRNMPLRPRPFFLKHQHATAKLILVLPPTSRMLTSNGPLKEPPGSRGPRVKSRSGTPGPGRDATSAACRYLEGFCFREESPRAEPVETSKKRRPYLACKPPQPRADRFGGCAANISVSPTTDAA